MDGLTAKLQEVEATRDNALKVKVDAEVIADELKRIFTIDKVMLEQAKAKVVEDLAATTYSGKIAAHVKLNSLLTFPSSLVGYLLKSSGLL